MRKAVLIMMSLLALGQVSCRETPPPRVVTVRIKPSQPLFRPRRLDKLDSVFANLGAGASITVRFVAPVRDIDVHVSATPNVQQGKLILRGPEGAFEYLPNKELRSVKKGNGEGIKLVFRGKPHLSIRSYLGTPDDDVRRATSGPLAELWVTSVHDGQWNYVYEGRSQKLEHAVQSKRVVFSVAIETSRDFQGTLSGWMQPLRK